MLLLLLLLFKEVTRFEAPVDVDSSMDDDGTWIISGRWEVESTIRLFDLFVADGVVVVAVIFV